MGEGKESGGDGEDRKVRVAWDFGDEGEERGGG